MCGHFIQTFSHLKHFGLAELYLECYKIHIKSNSNRILSTCCMSHTNICTFFMLNLYYSWFWAKSPDIFLFILPCPHCYHLLWSVICDYLSFIHIYFFWFTTRVCFPTIVWTKCVDVNWFMFKQNKQTRPVWSPSASKCILVRFFYGVKAAWALFDITMSVL